MILFYDTETTGLPEWKLPSDDWRQPHLIQLAVMLTDDDGAEQASWSTIVRPGHRARFSPEAIAAHGITYERAMDEGIDAGVAIDAMMDLAGMASLLVGHNIPFDNRIVRITTTRTQSVIWEPRVPWKCTMRMATPIVNLPPTPKMLAAGFNKPKSPNLGECVRFFFDEALEGAHDAMVDVRACMRVFFSIQQKEIA